MKKNRCLLLLFLLPLRFSSLWESTGQLSAQTIAAGAAHCLSICPDSTLQSWGFNASGQLGDSSNANTSIAVQVKNLTGIISVSAGGVAHSIALKNDGSVWAWGMNNNAQLGDSTITNSNVAIQVHGNGNVGFLTGITALAKGHLHHHNLALKNDSTVWAWGFNLHGQLGDSTTIDKRTPVPVYNLANVTELAAGDVHSIALKSDSTVWAWGYNSSGQLGDSTLINKLIPVKVKNLSGIIDIAAGEIHSLALKSDGTVWAWGDNSNGQLGDSTNNDSQVPIQVPGLSGIVAVSAGQDFSFALKSDGTIWSWGLNNTGQLGDSTLVSKWFPVKVKGLTGVVEVTGGGFHSIARKNDGTVWAWGMGNWGQLGNGTLGDPFCNCSIIPVQVLLGSCILTTEIDKEADESFFTVYPNPSSGKVVVECPIADVRSIEVYNLLGMQVYPPSVWAGSTQFPLPIAIGTTQLTINLSEANNGIYFLQIKSEAGTIVKKIIKK